MKAFTRDYIRRKIDLDIARRMARRNHPQPCDCPYCITPARARELLAANLARNPGAGEEVPF